MLICCVQRQSLIPFWLPIRSNQIYDNDSIRFSGRREFFFQPLIYVCFLVQESLEKKLRFFLCPFLSRDKERGYNFRASAGSKPAFFASRMKNFGRHDMFSENEGGRWKTHSGVQRIERKANHTQMFIWKI